MSTSWINIDQHGKMSVNPAAATEVLAPLGAREPLNLVSIFGAARQGKSFLMNCLTGREGTFQISNARDPCTQGIDISRTTMSVADFSTLDGGARVEAAAAHGGGRRGGGPDGGGAAALRIGFVDAEGQGDRDVNYDARLASPVLLSSKASDMYTVFTCLPSGGCHVGSG
jgi:hypothetical protein